MALMTPDLRNADGRGPRSKESSRRRTSIFSYAAMFGLAIFFLFPLVFMFVSSLKPDAQILCDRLSGRRPCGHHRHG